MLPFQALRRACPTHARAATQLPGSDALTPFQRISGDGSALAWLLRSGLFGSREMSADSAKDPGQPTPGSHPELLLPGEILPGISASELAQRRMEVMSGMPHGAMLLVPAAPVLRKAGIIPYPYRQSADFLYLTGCLQPGGVACLQKLPGSSGVKYTLFMPHPVGDAEVWDGHIADPEDALAFFGADEAYPVDALDRVLSTGGGEGAEVWYDVGERSSVWQRVPTLREWVRRGSVRSSRSVLHQQRWRKSKGEVGLMTQSSHIIVQALLAAMLASQEHPQEQFVAAVLEYQCRRRGAQHMAFPSVVAAGPRACTIHYSRHDRQIEAGEMLLVDAGCEYFGYCSDVTRVWSPHGDASPAQIEVYESVLEVQRECIGMCQPGNTLRAIHHHSVVRLCHHLVRLGVLKGTAEQAAYSGAYKPFYPTSVGHWLGLDTHDCDTVSQSTPLEPGVVLTIEPGLYLPASPQVPKQYQGIGVRIEDDILITHSGHEVLTQAVPREIRDFRRLLEHTT